MVDPSDLYTETLDETHDDDYVIVGHLVSSPLFTNIYSSYRD